MSATESNLVKQSLCHHRAIWCSSETCIQGVPLYFVWNISYYGCPPLLIFLSPSKK